MTETRKPLNPLERRENIGIADGSNHTGEHVTSSRHGIGTGSARAGKTGPKDTANSDQTDVEAQVDPIRRSSASGTPER
jgi:hypothetical protein